MSERLFLQRCLQKKAQLIEKLLRELFSWLTKEMSNSEIKVTQRKVWRTFEQQSETFQPQKPKKHANKKEKHFFLWKTIAFFKIFNFLVSFIFFSVPMWTPKYPFPAMTETSVLLNNITSRECQSWYDLPGNSVSSFSRTSTHGNGIIFRRRSSVYSKQFVPERTKWTESTIWTLSSEYQQCVPKYANHIAPRYNKVWILPHEVFERWFPRANCVDCKTKFELLKGILGWILLFRLPRVSFQNKGGAIIPQFGWCSNFQITKAINFSLQLTVH